MKRVSTIPVSAPIGHGCCSTRWAAEFFFGVVERARALGLLSSEHFTVDGTLIEAWASLKSFKRKDQGPSEPPADRGNPTVNFHGERRSNATHQSESDPEARLARKGAGKEARLCYSGNALVENRNSLLIDFMVEPADGDAERRAALVMLQGSLPGTRRITVAGDKGYDDALVLSDSARLQGVPFRILRIFS